MKKLIVILICFCLLGCTKQNEKIDTSKINVIDDTNSDEFSFDINCKEYMLVDISNFRVLYSLDTDKKIYPASLTKLMTLDTVLHLENNLHNTSSITYEQIIDLINDDASIAGLSPDVDYTLEELLYALILPSGADGALGLENYFNSININLIEEMNKQASLLGCTSSNFVNTTGLHDENHYTSLDDLFKIVLDILTFKQGRIILETLIYRLEDNTKLISTIAPIINKKTLVLGGKTGYTPEAGQSIMVLFRNNNRSYLLMVANAQRINYDDHLHYDDCLEIFDTLY